MKNILILILIIFLTGAGFAFAFSNNKISNKGALNMNKKTLVVYFSATGNTKKVANNLAKAIGSDIYEIKPLKPYSNADLDWRNQNSRSSVEMQNHNSRPEIVNDKLSVSDYDTIFVGFPIWWYIAPTIVNSFLEKHDFSGKTIVLFATSGGSGFGNTAENLKPSVSDSAKIIQGRVFSPYITVDELKKWVENLNL